MSDDNEARHPEPMQPFDDDAVLPPIIKPDPTLTDEQRAERVAAHVRQRKIFNASYFGTSDDHHRSDTGPEAPKPHLRPVPDTEDPTVAHYIDNALTNECDAVRTEPEGNRNARLNTAAFNIGQLIDGHHLTTDTAAQQLLEAATVQRPSSPLPGREARRTIESGLKAGMAHPRDLSDVGHDHPPVTQLDTPHPGSPDSSSDEPSSLVTELEAHFFSSPGVKNLPPPHYVVDGLLKRGALSWLFGPSGSKKSFLALSLCATVSLGLSWAGQDTHAPGPVLYITNEGEDELGSRVEGWEALHGGQVMGVSFLTMAVQILNPAARTALFTLIDKMANDTTNLDDAALAGAMPSLIVIDTQANAALGLDENDNAEMSRFVQAVADIRDHTDACVLVVHHTGKNGTTMRGASSVYARADTILRVSNDGPRWIDMTVDKQRNGPAGHTVRFQSQPVGDTLAIPSSDTFAADDTPPDDRVVNYLRTVPLSGATESHIIADCELPKDGALPLLNRLATEGRIVMKGSSGSRWAIPADDAE